MRSSLAPMIGPAGADTAEVRAMAGRVFKETGVVLINPDWLAAAADRRALIGLAEKVHGRRL